MLDNNKQPISSKSFNIAYYFLMVLKKYLNYLRVNPEWPTVDLYA
jgi:hypothetical protein